MTQFTLPELAYGYDALAPYMSAETLEFHHDKHHKSYVDNANRLIEDTSLKGLSLEEVVKKSHKEHPALFNNAAQHYNHTHFWKWMKKNGGGTPTLPEDFKRFIEKSFGSFENLKEEFAQNASTVFGSGWAWLMMKNNSLEIIKTIGGENPLIFDGTPLLGIDVWEHSYYIDHRNARPAYIKAFWEQLINWDYVVELFEKAKQ